MSAFQGRKNKCWNLAGWVLHHRSGTRELRLIIIIIIVCLSYIAHFRKSQWDSQTLNIMPIPWSETVNAPETSETLTPWHGFSHRGVWVSFGNPISFICESESGLIKQTFFVRHDNYGDTNHLAACKSPRGPLEAICWCREALQDRSGARSWGWDPVCFNQNSAWWGFSINLWIRTLKTYLFYFLVNWGVSISQPF